MISPELKHLLESHQYSFVGNHSAIKVCEWTKKSLLDKGVCYKEQFYGIKCHRCCQLSTTIGFCTNQCVYCWRPIEYTVGTSIKDNLDDPKEIIEKAIKAQQKQLIGFKGNKSINKKKLEEAMTPNQFAISLSGEPTLYPKLSELIKEIKKRDSTSFVVSNGLQPEVIKRLSPLPTNFYISLDSPNEQLFSQIDRSLIKDAWKRLNSSLEIMKTLDTTTVLRLTLIKGINMIEPENYAKLIKKAMPDFIEVKGYMWVGFSQQRLEKSNMPYHTEVKDFAKQLLKHLPDYILKDEKKESRVILLAKIKQ